ncbi:MAG: bifunctional [glutamate--ammonia ligase]-adenylyl-L-tyrosine phosphorylase/[glutamate--ammonia-ligase] adenylyltransferase [Pseudomonadota bacterium]
MREPQDESPRKQRAQSVARATEHSPFLAQALNKFDQIGAIFVEKGAEAAIAAALADHGEPVPIALRRQRHALALAVALGDLSAELPLERVTAVLSDFADQAIDRALALAIDERLPGASTAGFAVIALGKLGSRELNYSSDVDLQLLFDPAVLARRERDDPGEAAVRVGRRLVELLQQRTEDGYVARVDLRLRPSPEVTPIVLPVDAAISYYESQALSWERAAFIRARAAAGDRALGNRFLGEIRPFIWRRALDFGAIEEIRSISLRIRDHFAQGQQFGPGFDLKRGRGGIREAEFFTQVQQLIHGGREPELRAPATLDALDALAKGGRLEPAVAAAIGAGYRVLRTAEHRIQMVDDKQEHRLPVDRTEIDNLAALSGFGDGAAFLGWIAPHQEAVGEAFDGLVTEAGEILSNDPDILAREVAAMRFADVGQAVRLIGDWRSGRARSLRSPAARTAFEAMLPTLLRAIADSPDQGHALNRFADIVDKMSSGVNLFRLLEAQPRLASTLALILAHAPALAEQVGRRPGLLDGLIDQSSFAEPPDATATAANLAAAATGLTYGDALERIRLLVGERRFALGVQLIAGYRDPITIAEGYSDLAEGTIVALSALTAREFEASHGRIAGGELIVLALGRLGGRALTNASDLDLIYIYDAPDGAVSSGAKSLPAADYYNRLASRVSAALAVPTASGPLYDVDTRLRPQGAQGMLAVAVSAFETYQREEAWTWEHMALCRARPLTGSPAARKKMRNLVCSILKASSDPEKVRLAAAKMRADMAAHKPPAGAFDIKLGDGGLVDLEFAVHTLQLTRHKGLDPRLEVAIAELAEAGLIDAAADPDLRLLSAVLVVLRLVAPGPMEPAELSRGLVASLCGFDDWQSLVAAIDAARHRVARRWQDVKGQGDDR